MGRGDRLTTSGVCLAVMLGSLTLAGCSQGLDPTLQKYAYILAATDMQGKELVPVTDSVCPIFEVGDFTSAGQSKIVGQIGMDTIETWSISQPVGIFAIKSLEINIFKTTGACSAYVKQRSTF